MINILSKLTALIEKNKAYIVDGSLNRNLLAADARKYDPELLNLLQKDKELKEHFFAATDGGLIFKKDVFLQFIMNKEFLPDSYTKYKIKIGLGAEDGSLLSESGDVVLNWPYKDTILEGGQDKEDQKRSEVFFNEVLGRDQITRLLDDKVFTNWKRYDKNGEHELNELKDDDNLVIKGNNLVVLHSLKKRYAGKVKLIYIDPPYNTGNDSFGYNDNFNHSTWLTFMKNRLEAAKKLLADDGVIFVQCDDSEQAYLKVLMDEVFKGHFINTICVKAKASSGASGGGEDIKLKKNVEYIHCYYNKNPIRFKPVHQRISLEGYLRDRKIEGKSFAYSQALFTRSKPQHFKVVKDGYGNDIEILKIDDYEVKTVNQLAKTEGLSELEVYEKYYELMFASENAQTSIRDRVLSATDSDDTLYIARYKPVSGKNSGQETDVYFLGKTKRLVSFFSNVSERDKAGISKTLKVGTLWDDMSWSSIHLEGNVRLDQGKKPEKLIQRILDMSTEPGDLVLDYHLGSGTTAAAAHKMGRRYIGIEQLYYGDNDPTIRLQNVIGGDSTGISKSANWQGSGSFVYANIMNNSNKFRKRVEAAKNDSDYLGLFKEASSSSFLSYRVDPKKLSEDEFRKLSAAEKRRLLLELIDNNTLYVNYEDINDPIFKVSEKDKEINKKLYEKK